MNENAMIERNCSVILLLLLIISVSAMDRRSRRIVNGNIFTVRSSKFHTVYNEGEEYLLWFKMYLRVSKETFQRIVNLIRPKWTIDVP